MRFPLPGVFFSNSSPLSITLPFTRNTHVSRIDSDIPSLLLSLNFSLAKISVMTHIILLFPPVCFCHMVSFSKERAYVVLDYFLLYVAISRVNGTF